MESEKREVSYQEQAARNEIFCYLEAERKMLAEVLQEDIAQLVAIAKISLSGNHSSDAEDCLAMALSRLRALSFEVKPQILEEFGLAITLQELLHNRLNNTCHTTLYELPKNMGLLTETALFRLVQQILNALPTEKLSQFCLEVIRTGQHLCLKSRFKLGTYINSVKQVNLLMDKLYISIKHIIYMFNGNVAFQYFSDHEVEVMIYLDEINGIL